MHFLSRISTKQLLLVGIIFALLIAIPLTLYLVGQQQKTKSNAAQSTILSFDPSPSANSQVAFTKAPGDTITLPVYIDPGTGSNANTVSVLTLQIKFDPNVLSVADTTTCINTQGFALPQVTTQATCSSGDALVRVAASNINNFVTTKKQVAAITFTVNQNAPSGQTQVSFDTLTQAGSSSVSDPESNVISATLPAVITISAAATPTPTPTTAVILPTNTPVPTATPVPQQPQAGLPLCSSLTTNVATTGTVPLAINFTGIGSDATGVVQKATFNFGDGTVQDVAIAAPQAPTSTPTPTIDPNATATPTVDPATTPTDTPTPTPTAPASTGNSTAQLAHIYTAAGTYQASVTFTDDKGSVSLPGSCVQTITVNAAAQPPTNTPTLAPTGPGENIVGIGIVGVVLTIIGGLLFFAL